MPPIPDPPLPATCILHPAFSSPNTNQTPWILNLLCNPTRPQYLKELIEFQDSGPFACYFLFLQVCPNSKTINRKSNMLIIKATLALLLLVQSVLSGTSTLPFATCSQCRLSETLYKVSGNLERYCPARRSCNIHQCNNFQIGYRYQCSKCPQWGGVEAWEPCTVEPGILRGHCPVCRPPIPVGETDHIQIRDVDS